jgi:uncharacterized protein (DUF1810 family)
MNTVDPEDRFDLSRFVRAQAATYAQALAEIESGRKTTHWMWFIFPQFLGLGSSNTAIFYAIRSLDEAREYLNHEVLGARLAECSNAIIEIEGRSAHDIFGSPDDLKLRSCATLFARVAGSDSVFDRILAKYFDDKPDPRTLELLAQF